MRCTRSARTTPCPLPPTFLMLLRCCRKKILLSLLPKRESIQLLQLNWRLLLVSFWAVIIIFSCRDALAFVLHRASQRLTNLGEP